MGNLEKPSKDLVENTPATEPSKEEPIERGQWYWIKDDDGDKHIACVTHIGTNYVELNSVGHYSWEILFKDFDKETTRELDFAKIIQDNIQRHQQNVKVLLNKIKQLSAGLGIMPILPGESSGIGTALAVASKTVDLKAHKRALVRAKNKTLPKLFKEVEEEHGMMAMWMKGNLIPMKAEMEVLKSQTGNIEDKIFTVELYAGLCEEMAEIKSGEPASNDEKVHLFQRRHYMDEECLVEYKAGGMEFKSIRAFDKWMAQKENFERILPFPKSIVAFRVRHYDKERHATSIAQFIQFWHEKQEDMFTFLYIRNGERCFRLVTEIDFGENLFPAKGVLPLTQGKLYVKTSFSGGRIDRLISEQEYRDIVQAYKESKAKYAKEKAQHKKDMEEWRKLSKAEKKEKGKPYLGSFYEDDPKNYEHLTQDSVRYDDAMEQIAQIAKDHNRIAIVLQGILDRSESLHPHPPWRLWEDSGFQSAIKLVFDNSGLTSGDPPDFEAYRRKLNQKLIKGSNVVGQQDAWERVEAEKENRRRSYYGRSDHYYSQTHYSPYGNPGPGHITRVHHISRDKSKCYFQWERERQIRQWRHDSETITTHFSCSSDLLLNVDAYNPGDFKIFYNDHRTRADYLQWAPLLLAAEDFHAKQVAEL